MSNYLKASPKASVSDILPFQITSPVIQTTTKTTPCFTKYRSASDARRIDWRTFTANIALVHSCPLDSQGVLSLAHSMS
jgi:acyl-CoA hydrolase